MSCDGNRGVYFTHICATAGAGSGVSPDELETLYDKNVGQPKSELEALANDAKTTKLFDEMRKAKITPPTHSADGLPKVRSRRGYAAVYDDLKRRGWIKDEKAQAPVAVTGDAVPAPGRLAARPGRLAEEESTRGGRVAVASLAAAPIVAVQSKPGKIDAVSYRIGNGETLYIWGGNFMDMKDAVKAIPGGTKKPWFLGGHQNVWVLSCTAEEAEVAMKARGWQISTGKPDVSSVIRAGAAIVDSSGRELVAASPPTPELVPVHGADGSLAWVPEGTGAIAAKANADAAAAAMSAPAAPTPTPAAPTPASEPPPAPKKSKAELQREAREAAREAAKALIAVTPRVIDAANGEAEIDPTGQTAIQLQKWADAARDSADGDVKVWIDYGDRAYSATAKAQYYAQAAAHSAGVQRCPECQQFMGKDHTCPDKRFDADGFNRRGVNRRGYNKQGFDADGKDSEGYDVSGFRTDPVTGQHISRRGYTVNGLMPNGRHESGYTQFYDDDGLDFYGFDRDGRDREGFDRDGYDIHGYDRNGYNRNGFNADGEYIAGAPDERGVYFDGLDADGYDPDGFDAKGIDPWDFDRNGLIGVSKNAGKLQRLVYKDGRDKEGMRYSFAGYDLQGYTPTGYNRDGLDRNGEKRLMTSPKTGKRIRATYDEHGVDPNGFNRQGFSTLDGLSEPDAQGRRLAANGWVFDPERRDLYDPEDPTRRIAHTWEWRDVKVGRVNLRKVVSTGSLPPFTPPPELINGRTPPSEFFNRGTGRNPEDKRLAPYPLSTRERLDVLRVMRDPQARRSGVVLKCPYCGQFTGAGPHLCAHFRSVTQIDKCSLGASVLVAPNGVVIDARGEPGELYHGSKSVWNPASAAQNVVYNPAVPDYDPTYRFAGYSEQGRDADGYDRNGYNRAGYNKKGYNREGFDLFGYDTNGYDRNGYNRQGKNREGQQRPLTVDELKRGLPPGEEPLATDEMAAHYSRLAQAITNKPVTVKFDKSIPTGATDMRGNIYLNPHPLGKDADPRRNFLVTKAIMYHEVGHELTTNPDHWAELKGIAQSPEPVEGIDKGRAHVLRVYNIVEDGRMEREMSDRFPGVAGVIAAAARLRDKWDFKVGEGIPTLYQIQGALLYTTLPYYRVPQEVVDKMTPEARALFEELRPIALKGALGSQEDALEASKEIVRRLERAGVYDAPQEEQKNLEVTPPGGNAGNRAPKPPKKPAPPTPPGPVNEAPKKPEQKQPQDGGESGESGQDGGESGSSDDKPNGRGKGWRKGLGKGDQDDGDAGGSSGGDDDEDGQGSSSGGQEGDEDADADDGTDAGSSSGGEEGQEGSSGSSSGSSGGDEGEEGQEGSSGSSGGSSGSQGGSQSDEGEEGQEGSSGGSSGSSGGAQGEEGQEGSSGGSGGSSGSSGGDEDGSGGQGDSSGGDNDADGDGSGGGWGNDDDEGEEDGSSGSGGGSGGSQGDESGDDDSGEGGGAQGGSSGGVGGSQGDGDEGDEGGNGGSSGGSQGGQQSRSQGGQQGEEDNDGDADAWGDEGGDSDGSSGGWGDEGDEDGDSDGQNGGQTTPDASQSRSDGTPPAPQRPQANPDTMLEPEMGDGSDHLGGDGSSGASGSGPVAVSGEMFDPIKPFTDADLDAALRSADREAAQVIAAQVRRQANYDVLGKKLHRRLGGETKVNQPYRTPDGRAMYTDVVAPRSTNAAHMRTLEPQAALHREVSGKLARQLQTIRAQTEQRVRFQTSGKLDNRRLVAAVRGVDEVRKQVRDLPATSMAVSVTLDFSYSMVGHIRSGKVYNAGNILGSTFEQLDMPYEMRGHADHEAIFKSMDDEKRDPARMAMLAVQDNGCGAGNASTATTMTLATSSLMARDEKNKLIVSLMDGDMGDHDATVSQLGEARKQGVVTFGVFLGQPSEGQQARLTQMFGAGSWVQINDLNEMPQAVGRRLARVFESIGKK